MRRFGNAWIEAIRKDRFAVEWSDVRGPRLPTMPWIKVPLHPVLFELFRTHGEERTFEPGEALFPTTQVTHFLLVTSGLTARNAATRDGQTGAPAMALSSPGRLAAGNLNWVTRRPAIGRYRAISQASALSIPHVAFEDLIEARPDKETIWRALFAQFEMGNLSDRLAFSALALLPAPQRLQAFYLAWAVFYGKFEEAGGRLIVSMPSPGRRSHIEEVISVSSVTMDKLSTQLHTDAAFERDGEFLTFEAAWLQEAHDWMRFIDGDGVLYVRPKRVEEFLLKVQAGDYF